MEKRRPQIRNMFSRKGRRALLVVMLLGGIWFSYQWQRIAQMAEQAAPRHADVGMVLGAAVWGEGPSPGLRERLEQAVRLYQDGYVSTLLVTGGLGEGKTKTEAEVSRDYLVAHGIPAERILLENQSTSTYENLLYSQQVFDDYRMQHVLIISHDYHLARAMTMAESLGWNASAVGVHSDVLFGPYHRGREVLALTYWEVSRLVSLVARSMVLAANFVDIHEVANPLHDPRRLCLLNPVAV
ncbi:YdcF family protein [Brevibacillus sp. SAFN-007a]|uniref:YdcF family protein n=1 Tax=Brevibacillus sp. SAFN-007a TaxID=3436862 RepID=UPI003F80C969